MNIEDNIFLKSIPDFEKLIKYGFKKNGDKYFFEKVFKNGEFKAIITISTSKIITGKVYDIENNDEYLPFKVSTKQGVFINQIRQEYEAILIDIKDKCFSEKFFISDQANRITDTIIAKYSDKPIFMWKQFPDYGVFKNPLTNKWYGIIMNIEQFKIGKKGNNIVEIINLKLDSEKIQKLLNKDGYFQAWHMNKKFWITVILDDTLSDNEILKFVDESYSYTIKKEK